MADDHTFTVVGVALEADIPKSVGAGGIDLIVVGIAQIVKSILIGIVDDFGGVSSYHGTGLDFFTGFIGGVINEINFAGVRSNEEPGLGATLNVDAEDIVCAGRRSTFVLYTVGASSLA